jgi:DNA-directed RNA polymerase II subunit RPB1
MKIRSQMEITRLSDILDRTEIYWDPPSIQTVTTDENGATTTAVSHTTSLDEDEDILKTYREFEDLMPKESCSPWLLRMKVNREKLLEVNLTMLDVYIKMFEMYGNHMECEFADDNAPELIFRVRLISPSLPNSVGVPKYEDDAVASLKALEHNLVHNVLLKGVPGIRKIDMRPLSRQEYDDEDLHEYVEKTEWVLNTDGSNLIELLSNPLVDSTRTFSNDVWEIYKALGIEAARIALYNEIMEVIKESSVNFRHLSVLIDTMTLKGTLMSNDRHGINRGDVGPLAKSSFEESTDMLINASVFSEYDRINGVSANIMLGQVPPCGTGDTEIYLDEGRYLALVKERKQRKSKEKASAAAAAAAAAAASSSQGGPCGGLTKEIAPMKCDIEILSFDHDIPEDASATASASIYKGLFDLPPPPPRGTATAAR